MKSKPLEKVPPKLKSLYELAKKSRKRSYSPYSGHQVGAAIRTSGGKLYGGCNVENSSYGATICAERVAIQKAISEGPLRIAEVMVVTDSTPPWPPCGMCRQVIAEFGPDALLYTANLKGQMESFQLSEIFSQAFTPAHLRKKK
ncbi:MAG: cytidine deaminase [Bdellovibrionales bacterium]|nr:cytidine deaminase [Bdellovibrionales bacterium]